MVNIYVLKLFLWLQYKISKAIFAPSILIYLSELIIIQNMPSLEKLDLSGTSPPICMMIWLPEGFAATYPQQRGVENTGFCWFNSPIMIIFLH